MKAMEELSGNREPVSGSAFIQLLWESYPLKQHMEKGHQEDLLHIFHYGKKKGWLSQEDILYCDNMLERKNAAKILHLFLKRELCVPDLMDISAAGSLIDLYDCRICVQHVAQVYLRKIMEPATRMLWEGKQVEVFGMRDGISPDQAKEIIARLFSDFSTHCLMQE